MKTKLTIAAATAALAAGGIAAAGAGATASSPASAAAAAAAAKRHLEGRVTAIDRSSRTFSIRDAERGTLRVRVTSATRFERVTFSALRAGTRVDVRARRVDGVWNATKVERGTAAEVNHETGDDRGAGHGGGDDDPAGHR